MHAARYTSLDVLWVVVTAIAVLDSWYIIHRAKQLPAYVGRYFPEAAHRDRDSKERAFHYAWELGPYILLGVAGIVGTTTAILRFL